MKESELEVDSTTFETTELKAKANTVLKRSKSSNKVVANKEPKKFLRQEITCLQQQLEEQKLLTESLKKELEKQSMLFYLLY